MAYRNQRFGGNRRARFPMPRLGDAVPALPTVASYPVALFLQTSDRTTGRFAGVDRRIVTQAANASDLQAAYTEIYGANASVAYLAPSDGSYPTWPATVDLRQQQPPATGTTGTSSTTTSSSTTGGTTTTTPPVGGLAGILQLLGQVPLWVWLGAGALWYFSSGSEAKPRRGRY